MAQLSWSGKTIIPPLQTKNIQKECLTSGLWPCSAKVSQLFFVWPVCHSSKVERNTQNVFHHLKSLIQTWSKIKSILIINLTLQFASEALKQYFAIKWNVNQVKCEKCSLFKSKSKMIPVLLILPKVIFLAEIRRMTISQK